MYIIKDANTGKIMMESYVNAFWFNDKVDAESFVNDQAEVDLEEYKKEYDDYDLTLEDFISNYEIVEVKFEVGYGDTEMCHTREDVMREAKYSLNIALKDPLEDYSIAEATEAITFKVDGDCSEINGSYDLWEINDNGEIIQSNLPDCIRNIF